MPEGDAIDETGPLKLAPLGFRSILRFCLSDLNFDAWTFWLAQGVASDALREHGVEAADLAEPHPAFLTILAGQSALHSAHGPPDKHYAFLSLTQWTSLWLKTCPACASDTK